MKKKIIINMLSSADKVPGQGVGSAYLELVRLLTRGGVKLDIRINAHGKADINHFHTVDPQFFLKMKASKAVNVVYCHFLPDTLDGSIRIPRLFFGIFKRYVTAFYRSADYLVVVNPIFKKELERYGIKKEWSISPTMSVKRRFIQDLPPSGCSCASNMASRRTHSSSSGSDRYRPGKASWISWKQPG